jgi:hypothetical protein
MMLAATIATAYYAMVNVGAMALIAGGQPRKALDLINNTVARSRQIAAGPELPFYLDATRLLTEAAMASSPSDSGLMQAADIAEKAGLFSAAPIYRSSAVRAAIVRGDLAAAQSDWAILSPLEAKLLANATRPRDAVRVLLEHCRLDRAQQRFTDAAARLEQVIALIPAGRRPPIRGGERSYCCAPRSNMHFGTTRAPRGMLTPPSPGLVPKRSTRSRPRGSAKHR